MAIFKDYPDTSTPLSGDFLNQVLEMLLPIGKTEMFYDAEDHSNYMGFTWELTLIGKMPIGIDVNDKDFSQIGKSSGEKTHKLTTAEMPKHTHTLKTGARTAVWAEPNYAISYQYQAASTINSAEGMESSGSSQAHNNMPPYEVVAFWKRIS